MSVRVRDVVMGQLDALRHEPTEKRIRATLGDVTVVDSTRALLVWEPKRVVPTYALPLGDVAGEIFTDAPVAEEGPVGAPATGASHLGHRLVYDPSVPFSAHTTEGAAVIVRVAGVDRDVAAFRPADPDLADYLLLDFDAFDAWYEEDERNVAHPRDPFHRIDVLHGSRHVRVELDGVVLAESTSPYLLFEPPLPVRYYFAVQDVHMELLEPSDRLTYCAYKGEASYFSVGDQRDLAWCYRQPLHDAAEVADRIAFFDERADVIVDGVRGERPITPWSPRD